MNLIKVEDLKVVPSEEIGKRLGRKYGKIVFDDEINEIGEELNIDEIEYKLVNSVLLNQRIQ